MKDIMLIFDLDGTLWDSGEEVACAWNEILAKRCPEQGSLTAEDIHSVMGKTMDDIARILMPDMEAGLRKQIFDECMCFENEYIALHGGKLFPGIRETLEKLLTDGYKMSIVSNCQKGYINAFLVSMDMKKYFCDIEEWGATGLSKGENIRLVMKRNGFERALYIGDTRGDETSARQAEIPFIYAAYGFGDAKAPDGELQEFSELAAEVEKFI